MVVFKKTGFHFVRFLRSIAFFFAFFGHLVHSCKNIVTRHLSISWKNVLKILFYSGAYLTIPLMVISALMAMSLAINCYTIFSKFLLQSKALSIAQTFLVHDLLPLLIGFVLCLQVSLNMINARIKITKLQRTAQEVILEYILPIIIGINISGLLLYIYMMSVAFLSLYLTFHYMFNVSTHTYLLDIERTTTLWALGDSIAKTLLYCSIVSFTAGYYYYQVATRHFTLRRAVSRILTRGFFWLIVISVFIKLMNL